MERETYYIDFGGGTTYFHVVDGIVICHDKNTNVPYDKLLSFIAVAKELGMKAGKL